MWKNLASGLFQKKRYVRRALNATSKVHNPPYNIRKMIDRPIYGINIQKHIYKNIDLLSELS